MIKEIQVGSEGEDRDRTFRCDICRKYYEIGFDDDLLEEATAHGDDAHDGIFSMSYMLESGKLRVHVEEPFSWTRWAEGSGNDKGNPIRILAPQASEVEAGEDR